MAGPQEAVRSARVTKLTSSIRSATLVVALLVLAGCGKNAALPWHYWIAPAIALSVLLLVCISLPLKYYRKVYRLKHRGR